MCNTFFECLIALLLTPIIICIIGLVSLIVGLTSKIPIDVFSPTFEKISPYIKVSEKLGFFLRNLGLCLVVISAFLALIIYNRSPLGGISPTRMVTPATIPAVSPTQTFTATITGSPTQITNNIGSPSALVSISFKVNGWYPRVIDLRTTSDIGIPVLSGYALNFFDIWVNTPERSITKDVTIEFYVNDILVGEIERSTVQPGGLTKLPDINIDQKFVDKIVGSNYWKVENSWGEIVVKQINYDQDGNTVATSQFPIRLNPKSTSWLTSAPDVSIASIAYSINGGTEKWIEVQNALLNGLEVKVGDKFKITKVLYRVEFAVPDQSFGIEASLLNTKGSYVNNWGAFLTESGTHSLSKFVNPLEWVIDNDSKILSLRLARIDGTVVDSMEIPIYKK